MDEFLSVVETMAVAMKMKMVSRRSGLRRCDLEISRDNRSPIGPPGNRTTSSPMTALKISAKLSHGANKLLPCFFLPNPSPSRSTPTLLDTPQSTPSPSQQWPSSPARGSRPPCAAYPTQAVRGYACIQPACPPPTLRSRQTPMPPRLHHPRICL